MSTPIFNFFEKDFSVAAILYNRNSKRTGRPGQDGKTEVITICYSPFSCLDREHRPQPERIGGGCGRFSTHSKLLLIMHIFNSTISLPFANRLSPTPSHFSA
jgi:hypothetical protein